MKIKGVARKKIGEKSVTHSHRLKYVPGAKARAETMAAEIKHRRLSKKHERMEHAVWPTFGVHSRAEAERIEAIKDCAIPPATHYAVDFDKNGQPVKIVPVPARPGGPIDPPSGRTLRCSEIVPGGDQCVREWQHDGPHRYRGGPFRSTAATAGPIDFPCAGLSPTGRPCYLNAGHSERHRDDLGSTWPLDPRTAHGADELRGERTPRESVVGKYEAIKDHHPPKGAKWAGSAPAPLNDVLKAKEARREPAPVPGILALVAVLDTTIERLEHRLTNILRPEDPTASPRVSDSDLARRIEGCVIDINEIIERVDV